MRQLALAFGVLCAAAVAHRAGAQNPTQNPPQTNPLMQGQVVGTVVKFNPVGTTLPQAGARVGQPLNMPAESPLMRRADLSKPFDAFRGTNLSPSNVVAPVPGLSNATSLERFYEKMKASIGLGTKPAMPAPPTVTPGIFRRNRERAKEQMWWRD